MILDAPIKLCRKFNTYVPYKKKPGAPIDWEALAKSRNFFNNSAHEMFRKLYANTEEDSKNGKYSVAKLAPYLGVSVRALSKALKEYGFTIVPKSISSKYNNSNRTKYSYPYIRLGFKTERKMWEFFIENKITPKIIINRIYEETGRCFLRRIVDTHLYNVKKIYKRDRDMQRKIEEEKNIKMLDTSI